MSGADGGDFSLRKNAQTRQYGGQEFEGEDRVISVGDSLWNILIKEKGIPEARFGQALVIIRGLNPQIKQINVLRVGDKIFIPLQPESALAVSPKSPKNDDSPTAIGRGTVQDYRVKVGDSVYHILREQLGVRDDRELAQYYMLIKDLNPERKNWDVLLVGDIIRLPERLRFAQSQTAPVTPSASVTVKDSVASPAGKVAVLDPKRLPARDNLPLVSQVIEALGGEIEQAGEETLDLKDSTVRLDRASYPVVSNPKLQQRVVLDTADKIPPTLRSRMADTGGRTSVVAFDRDASVQNTVEQILARLGYQALPADQSVVIQHGGVSFEAKGDWVALSPEQTNKAQEIFVLNLSQTPSAPPDYLREELARQGLHLKDILAAPLAPVASTPVDAEAPPIPVVRYWPREKREFVDAMLRTLQVPFASSETLKTQLRDGLSIELRCDRVLDRDGKRTVIFFNAIDNTFKAALQDREKIRVMEIDLGALDHKSIAARLLSELGDTSIYKEHRFPVSGQKDKLQVTAWGFLLANRGMFLTDRDIPPPLYRFFFEKGLEIVYF